MSILAQDNFDRANSTSLGTGWTEASLDWSINSNQLQCQANASGNSGVVATTTSLLNPAVADCKVTVTVNTGTGFDGGPIARYQGAGVFYALDVWNNGSGWVAQIYRHSSFSSSTAIGSLQSITAHTAGTNYTLEVSGTGATVTLKAYRNGTLLNTATDTSGSRITAAGHCGAYSWTSSSAALFDDFKVEDLVTGPALAVSVQGGSAVADGGTDSLGALDTGSTVSRSYTLLNNGSATLTFGTPSVTVGSGLTITAGPSNGATLAAGSSVTLTVSVDTSTPGSYSPSVSVASDDPATPYNWTVNYDVQTPSVPADPSSLNATGGSGQIGLDWTDNSNNEVSFRVERSATGTGGWSEVGSSLANTPSYTDAGVSPSTTYYYRVKARNATGDSGYSNVASATTNSSPVYYVRGDGSDSNSGLVNSAGGAWATLQKANNTMVPGDTTLVTLAGNYAGVRHTGTGGTAGNYITFKAAVSGVKVNATAGGSANAGFHFEGTTGPGYFVIDGFEIDGTGGSMPKAGIRVIDGHHFIIRNNNVHNSGGQWGIFLSNTTDYEVRNNKSHDSGTEFGGEHGIYLSGAGHRRGIVSGNEFYSNLKDGIHTNSVFGRDPTTGLGNPAQDLLIEDNRVYNNGLSGMDIEGLHNSQIFNNQIYNNSRHGIIFHYVDNLPDENFPSVNNVVANNTIIANQAGIRMRAGSGTQQSDSQQTIFNNIIISLATANWCSVQVEDGADPVKLKCNYNVYNSATNRFSVNDGASPMNLTAWRSLTGEDANSILSTTTALFTDYASNDFTLKSTSPARNAGVSSLTSYLGNDEAAPTDDFTGASRPQGGTYDIGAYEYVESSGPVTTLYNSFKRRLLGGEVNLSSGTIKAMLVTSAYAPDQDGHAVKGDVTSEVSGTGYSAGGVALASKAVTQDNTNNLGVFDAADASWSGSTLTAAGCVLYLDTGVAGTSYLICHMGFGTDRSSNNGVFRVTFDPGGILSIA